MQVNDEVGIIRSGTWGVIHMEGLYRVSKMNKVRIHLQRLADGYERVFSAKHGREMGSERYRSAEIVSVARYKEIEARRLKTNRVRAAWLDAANAVQCKNLDVLKAAIATIEEEME